MNLSDFYSDRLIGKLTIFLQLQEFSLCNLTVDTSYNLYTTPFLSYPSQLTLVKLIKLKRTQTVCKDKERNSERKREKNREKTQFFSIFFLKKINSRQKKYKKYKKNALAPG